MSPGFTGCVSGLSVGAGTAPLKLLGSERLSLRGTPGSISSSVCGRKASLNEARMTGVYWRPPSAAPAPSSIRIEALGAADYRSLALGLGLGGVVLVACVVWAAVRAAGAAQGGVYKTHEGEPSLYLSPESSTAPLMPQRREWFI